MFASSEYLLYHQDPLGLVFQICMHSGIGKIGVSVCVVRCVAEWSPLCIAGSSVTLVQV